MRLRAALLACLLALPFSAGPALGATADEHYAAAVASYNAADYPSAIRSAEAATALDPSHWQAWQLDGNARYAQGDKKGALAVYRYSLRINPNNPQLSSFVTTLAAEAQPASPAASAASSGRMSKWRVAVWGGKHFTSLKAVRDNLDAMSQATIMSYSALGSTAYPSSEHSPGGIVGGIEIGREVDPNIGIGLKVGFMTAPSASSSLRVEMGWPLFLTLDQKVEVSITMMPLLAGGWYEGPITDRLCYRGALYLGLNFVKLRQKIDISFDSAWGPVMSPRHYEMTAPITSMAMEGAAELGYRLSDRATAFLEVGYLYTGVIESYTEAEESTGVEIVYGLVGTNEFDLSGVRLRAGVRLAF